MLSTSFDRHLGGRSIDNLIVDIIADDFQKKKGIDPRENKKSLIKLRKAAETAKKNLSPVGITKSQINIECLYEDYDYNGVLELDVLIKEIKKANLLTKLETVAKRALEDFRKLEAKEPISFYEIIGGSLRIPIFKETLATVFSLDKNLPNMGLSTTLNMDECVSTGAGWLSATLSPRFRIKEYGVRNQ